MTATITEENTGHDSQRIIYPEVTSCITITVFTQDKMYGAHLNLMPQRRSPNAVIEELLLKTSSAQRQRVLIAGHLDLWGQGYKATSKADQKIKHDPSQTLKHAALVWGDAEVDYKGMKDIGGQGSTISVPLHGEPTKQNAVG